MPKVIYIKTPYRLFRVERLTHLRKGVGRGGKYFLTVGWEDESPTPKECTGICFASEELRDKAYADISAALATVADIVDVSPPQAGAPRNERRTITYETESGDEHIVGVYDVPVQC
jgi:hypothetical protein